jgi:predicted aspartyl protease
VKITAYDPERDLIVVTSTIWGRGRSKELSLALDTGSASTMISSNAAEEIGYNPRDGMKITSVSSAIGTERGYTLKVARFATLGFEFQDFVVHVFDLPVGFEIDGLIGLNFLQNFDYKIRSLAGQICVRPAEAPPA